MMLQTLASREKFVNDLLEFVKCKYDLCDTQIFIFGSFLTDDYEPGKSDIDIGVYSEKEAKMYNIQLDIDLYLNEKGIKHDIVIMDLHDKLWINIPIMMYGKELTPYESEEMFVYLCKMIDKWGYNPAEKVLQEVV